MADILSQDDEQESWGEQSSLTPVAGCPLKEYVLHLRVQAL